MLSLNIKYDFLVELLRRMIRLMAELTQMNYCYCLFCETKRCQQVANALEKAGIHRALSPKIIKRQRRQGKNIDILFDLLPGYVFVYSSEPVDLSAMMVECVIIALG